MAKKRIAVYGDSPTVPTGFGRVVRDIFSNLTDDFQVSIFGINYNGYPHRLPFDIYPAALPTSGGAADPYGRAHFQQWVARQQFDLLFLINDGWLLRAFMPEIIQEMKKTKGDVPIVLYFPVDVEETEREWYAWITENITTPVTYTEFARNTIVSLVPELKDRLLVIPHGADTATFKPLSKDDQYVRKAKELAGGGFTFINVNRNQVRKNIPATLAAMRQYLDLYNLSGGEECTDNLVLHMAGMDPIGCNVELLANSLKFTRQGVVRLSSTQVTDQELNYIYNGCNAMLTTSIGEGWGLSVTESIAAGLPVLAPKHTSFPEVVRDFGYLYDPGQKTCALPHGTDRSNWRYYCDPAVVAGAMLEIRQHYDDWRDRAMKGREWYSGNRTWRSHIAPQWRKVFKQLVS